MKQKAIVSVVAFLVSFFVIVIYRTAIDEQNGGDIQLQILAAQEILQGRDPYAALQNILYLGKPTATYPLPTFLLLIPFALTGETLGSWLFFSFSTALLVFAILHNDQKWRLLILTSGIYAYSFRWMQFSPFLTAVYLLPSLLPLAFIKPQIGLPLFLMKPTWRRVFIIVCIFGLSFVIMPEWPLRWWNAAQNYNGFIPLLTLPFGPLIALALCRWKEPNARLLLLYSLFPQRGLYDLLPLLLIPKSQKQLFIICIISWPAVLLSALTLNSSILYQPTIVMLYLPILYLVLNPIPFIRKTLEAMRSAAPKSNLFPPE